MVVLCTHLLLKTYTQPPCSWALAVMPDRLSATRDAWLSHTSAS